MFEKYIRLVIGALTVSISQMSSGVGQAMKLVPKAFQEMAKTMKTTNRVQEDLMKSITDDQGQISGDFMTIGDDMRKVLHTYDERYSR